MPYEVRCPKGHKIQIGPSHFGREVRCPKCKAPFRIAAEAEPAPADKQEAAVLEWLNEAASDIGRVAHEAAAPPPASQPAAPRWSEVEVGGPPPPPLDEPPAAPPEPPPRAQAENAQLEPPPAAPSVAQPAPAPAAVIAAPPEVAPAGVMPAQAVRSATADRLAIVGRILAGCALAVLLILDGWQAQTAGGFRAMARRIQPAEPESMTAALDLVYGALHVAAVLALAGGLVVLLYTGRVWERWASVGLLAALLLAVMLRAGL